MNCANRHLPAVWGWLLDRWIVPAGVTGLVLLLLSLPLSHVMAVRSFAFVLLLIASGVLYFSGRVDKRLPLIWIFGMWLLAAILSLAEAPDALAALGLVGNEVGKSFAVFYATYVFVCAVGKHVIWFRAVATSLLLLASLAIGAWLFTGSWDAIGPVPPLGDYTTSALTLMPLVAFPLFTPGRKLCGRFALPFAVLVLLLALVAAAFSLSRGFWLIAAVMLVVATLAFYGKTGLNWKYWGPPIAGVLLVLMLAVLMISQWRGRDLLFFGDRSVIYGPVFRHLMDAPLTGFGYGHEAQKAWYNAHMADQNVAHAHNIVLSYAEQMGLPGILALLAIFAGLAQRFVRHLVSPDLRCSCLAALGLALVIGVFVRNNLDIFFVRHNLLLFFLMCGLLLGMIEGDGAIGE